jgi:hypothetical protein
VHEKIQGEQSQEENFQGEKYEVESKKNFVLEN